MEENNLVVLNSLALNCLDREEYAIFLTIMGKIRDRSIKAIEYLKQHQEANNNELRYPHDIELTVQYKIFQNNQRGERIKLKEYSEIPILLKVPLDKDPSATIKDISDYIIGIYK